MQWLKNRLYSNQYYKITKEGNQLSIFDTSPFEYILHIQNINSLRYHFIKDTYEIATPYPIYGMSVTINGTSYNLSPNEFTIQGNELFTEPLALWLCKHYLHIDPHPISCITVIDENMDIRSGKLLTIKKQLQNDIK